MSWRPEGWKETRAERCEPLRVAPADVYFEAGADAMHRADVVWILNHVLQAEGVFAKEDWEAFTLGLEENGEL